MQCVLSLGYDSVSNPNLWVESSSIQNGDIFNNHKQNSKGKFSKRKEKCSFKEDTTNSTSAINEMPSLELEEDSQEFTDKESDQGFLFKKRKSNFDGKSKKEKIGKMLIPNISKMTKEEIKMEKNRLSAKRSREKQKKRFVKI